jgi:hypothetical protein
MEHSFKSSPFPSVLRPDLRVIEQEDYSKISSILEDSTRDFKIIGTHSGLFHSDEVLATTILLYTEEFNH